jgi:hypothetical protein
MKKYIVLSVNSNVDYLYFTPLTIWAWRKFGWEAILFYNNSLPISKELEDYVFESCPSHQVYTLSLNGYRSDTITQISRLYSGCVAGGMPSYYMVGDIDMLPLSDYWRNDFSKPTVYGHDLTGFGHFPMCYIGMTAQDWNIVMNISDSDYNRHIKRDLDKLPQAKDPDFYKYWFTDQDLITQRLKEYGTSKIDFINRGQYANGYAKGRVDRGAWTLEHEQFIDAHLFQQTWQNDEKVRKTLDLLETVWPEEDFQWFRNYTAEFRKLAV